MRRSGSTTRWRCGEARRSRISPTRVSPSRQSPGSRKSGWRHWSSIAADLVLERHDELVGELEALTAEHPLRERLRTQLMTALYRSVGRLGSGRLSGRAPCARRRARIEPSTALHDLERAILRQDPSLGLRPRPPLPSGRRALDPRRRYVDRASIDALLAVAEPLVRTRRASGPGPAGAGATGLAQRRLARRAPTAGSERAASSPARPRSRRRRPALSWLGSRRGSTSISCSPSATVGSSLMVLPDGEPPPSSRPRRCDLALLVPSGLATPVGASSSRSAGPTTSARSRLGADRIRAAGAASARPGRRRTSREARREPASWARRARRSGRSRRSQPSPACGVLASRAVARAEHATPACFVGRDIDAMAGPRVFGAAPF